MPSPIAEVFRRCRDADRAALITYVTGGHPTLADTSSTLLGLSDAGADLIEIGLPYSDPIADGPVIAEAMHETLARGVSPSAVLAAARELAPRIRAPLLGMVSYSIVHRVGPEQFVAQVSTAGLRGLIVPDLDVDADLRAGAEALGPRCADAGIDLVLLASPTTAPARLERIAAATRGFLYVIARTGITGGGGGADLDEVARRLELLRGMTATPLAVGFGVSTPEHVTRLAPLADGVIVGTALVGRMATAVPGSAATAAAELVRALAAATRRQRSTPAHSQAAHPSGEDRGGQRVR